MLSGERKKFGLRTARKAAFVDGLSNVVVVYDGDSPKYCYIAFDHSFVDVIGTHLPRGVSAHDPAFIHVVFDHGRGEWVISACYVSSWELRTLWKTDSKPSWLKELKRVQKHDRTPNQARGTASAHHTSHATRTVCHAA